MHRSCELTSHLLKINTSRLPSLGYTIRILSFVQYVMGIIIICVSVRYANCNTAESFSDSKEGRSWLVS